MAAFSSTKNKKSSRLPLYPLYHVAIKGLFLVWFICTFSAIISTHFCNKTVVSNTNLFETNSQNSEPINTTFQNNASIQKKNSFETKIENTEQVPTKCWRHCPTRPNKIYFALEAREAGIGDRIAIINNLAQLAGYLCATLILPTASSTLARIHNDNTSLSPAIQWEDFINLTFIEDSVPVVSRYTRYPVNNNLTNESMPNLIRYSRYPVIGNLTNYLHIRSNDQYGLRRDFALVQSISWHQSLESSSPPSAKEVGSSFLWDINTDFNSNDLWRDALPKLAANIRDSYWFNRPENRPYLSMFYDFHENIYIEKEKRVGCMYTNFEVGNDGTPSHLKILRQRLLKRIYDSSSLDPILIFLHLRRGDLIETCDTSVVKLRKLIICSFNGTEDINRNMTLLLGSDERDKEYRHDVLQMVEEEVPDIKTLDIDEMSWSIVREAVAEGLIYEELINNYYIFLLQEDLRSKRVMVPPAIHTKNDITIHLRQHQSGCKDCFRIKERYNKRLKTTL